MTCQRCGNLLQRVPMFDLPRKVKEFSCLCCGERFWKIQGSTELKYTGQSSSSSPYEAGCKPLLEKTFASGSHRN